MSCVKNNSLINKAGQHAVPFGVCYYYMDVIVGLGRSVLVLHYKSREILFSLLYMGHETITDA